MDAPDRHVGRNIAAAVLALLLSASCGHAFDTGVARRVEDRMAPVATIASPQTGSPYSSAIQIKGKVSDAADAAGDPGQVTSLRYEVLASTLSGNVPLAADGSYDFTFLASGLSGGVTVKLTAVDWNGNEGTASVSLIDSGNGIPDFAALATSGQVSLAWSSVPLVDHYELYYETSDILPSEQFSKKVSPVTSPYVLSGLSNGKVHSFLLKSVPVAGSGAPSNWSAPQKAIPLSKVQLVPTAVPGYGSIALSWLPLPSSTGYEVWKGTSPVEASMLNVSGTIQGSSFVDEAVTPGTTYYYAVQPALYSDIKSYSTSVSPVPLPPDSRRELASLPSGTVSKFALSADKTKLYAIEDGTIAIYDLSTPSSPIRVGSLPAPSHNAYSDLPTGGSYVYTPTVMPWLQLRASTEGYLVAIAGADDGTNINYGRTSVIDVSNPAAPVEVAGYDANASGSYLTDLEPIGLAIGEPADTGAVGILRIWLSEFTWNSSPRVELVDFDLSAKTLTSKRTIGDSNIGNGGRYIETRGNLACLSQYNGLDIFQTDAGATSLSLASSFVDTSVNASSLQFFVKGASTYVCYGTWAAGIKIVDLTNPAAPVAVTPPSSWSTLTVGINDIALADSRAWVGTNGSGLLVFDMSDPLAATPTASFPVSPFVGTSALVGRDLYLGFGTSGWSAPGIKVIDAGIPRPTYTASATGPNYLREGALSGKLLYAPAGLTIEIYDVSTSPPTRAASYSTAGEQVTDPTGIAISGNILVTGGAKVLFYDISSPLSPVLLSSVAIPQYLTGVAIRGSLVYVTCRDFGLKIIDISTPTAPKELGICALSSSSRSIGLSGDYAIVPHGNTYAAVIDVADPLNPVLVKDVALANPSGNNFVNGVAVQGGVAYIGLGGGGLSIVDFSVPSSAVEKAHVASPVGDFQGFQYLAAQGDYLFASRYTNGLSLFYVRNPAAPSLVSTVLHPAGLAESVGGLVLDKGMVYALSNGGFQGLIVYDMMK
ncbi:MAG TPA: hypothetical protein VMV44_03800 [Rectinemataceae bacterium]|nr:hypothetical protein [Rectinemataceae bacterium]